MPFASAWSLWWIADRAGDGFARFWDAPIFFPTLQSFAFSEPLLLEGLAATPLLWAGAEPVLAHNLVLLLALVTNGAFAYALLRGLALGPLAAGAGGALVCLLPYVHHELGVLTLVPLAGVLALLHALIAFARSPTLLGGARIGVAFAAAWWLCGQYALLLVLAAGPAAACLAGRAWLAPRSLLALALAAAVAAALVAPVARVQLEVRRTQGFSRPEWMTVTGSAAPGSFALTPARPWLPFPGIEAAPDANQQAHFPGILKLALALVGLAWGLKQRELRRACAFLALLGLGGVLLAVLPRVELLGVTPFHWLREVVPGLALLRSFWRATMFAQVAIALLAAIGIQALSTRARARRWALGGVATLAAFATLELWPPSPLLSEAPSREAWAPWLAWIAEHVPPGEALVHLPVNATESASDYEPTARAMLLATAHGRPLVNGYSSYFPPSYRSFVRLMQGCPKPTAWQLLRRVGSSHVLLRSSWLAEDPRCAPAPDFYRQAAVFPELDAEIWQAVIPGAPAPVDTPDAR